MSKSASLSRLLPVLAAGFLQACSEPPETIVIDKSEETQTQATEKALALNKSAEKVLADMKRTSADGKGYVFFKDGVGIVYPKSLSLVPSAVVQQSFCTAYHPETWRSEKTCATREIESLATLPKIYSPAPPLYINALKSVVCPGKPSALFSLTDAFDSNRDKSPCQDISPATLPTPAVYRHVMQEIRASKVSRIEKPALEWAHIMPAAL